MEPVIEDRPATTIAGLQIRTVPMSPEIPALWPHFVPRIEEIGQRLVPGETYGVMSPAGPDMTQLDYLAGVAVADGSALPEGITRWTLPAATYAVFRVPFGSIGPAYDEIFRRWLPGSAYVQATSPLYERYDPDFCPDRAESLVDIGVPVRPR